MRIIATYPNGARIIRMDWRMSRTGNLKRIVSNTRHLPFRNEEFQQEETFIYDRSEGSKWQKISRGASQNSLEVIEILKGRCVVELMILNTRETISIELKDEIPSMISIPVSSYAWRIRGQVPNTILKLKRNYRNFVRKSF